MGLFKFFRRSDKTSQTPLSLKAQAYNATAPASPPLKGKSPVRGNGPVSVQTLQQGYVLKSAGSIVSLSLNNEPSALPPPILSRFRSETLKRPTTAPHSQSGSGSRPVSRSRRESILGPPLSFRKPRADSYILHKRQSFESSHSHRTTVGYPAPQPEFYGHDRTLSIQSNGTTGTRQFVDLLDAQSELRPTNFHTRVRASGVRDYGEDVADRNLGENGVDLRSPLVQAFYASTGDSAPSPGIGRTAYRDEDILKNARRPSSRGARAMSMKSLKSLKSLKSHTSELCHTYHEQSTEPMPMIRMPLNSPTKSTHHVIPFSPLIPPVPSPARDQPRTGRQRRSESMFLTNNARNTDFSNIPLPGQLIRPKSSHHRSHAASQEHLTNFVSVMATNPPEEFRDKKLDRRARRMIKAKSTMSTVSSHLELDEPPVPSSRPSLRRTASALDSTGPEKAAEKRISRASFKPSSIRDSSNTSRVSVRDSRLIPQVCNPVEGMGQGHTNATQAEYHTEDSGADYEGPGIILSDGKGNINHTEDDACPPPSIATGGHRRSRVMSHGSSNRARTSVMISPTTSDGMEEMLYNQRPKRSSDVRQWSLSSMTTPPTTVSSVASLRPQSDHTADSSFDANHQQQAPGLGLEAKNHSTANLSIAATSRPQSVCATASVHMPHSPLTALSNFNIDDYISSDDDVLSGSMPIRRERGDDEGESEEELLFRDVGYGSMQLPGLFDTISQTAGTGTATPVPLNGAGNSSGEVDGRSNTDKVTTSVSGSSVQGEGTVTDPQSQSSGSSPLLSLMVPTPSSQGQGSQRSIHRTRSLRHASSVPATRRHSAMGTLSYSSSEYAEEGSIRGSRPSTSGNSYVPSQLANSFVPPIPPRRRPLSIVVPMLPSVLHASEDESGGDLSASESTSDFEEEDRHLRAEFTKSLGTPAGQSPVGMRQYDGHHPSPGYAHGPILRIPLPIKPPTPDTRKPTLPAHQTDGDNSLLPVHQIQLPMARRNKPGTVAHALEHLRYSPAIMHSSSSEYLGDNDDDDQSAVAPDIPRSRPGSRHAPSSIGTAPASKPVVPPLPLYPHGYAYGHGGPKYGNGYGFVRVLPEQQHGSGSANGSTTPGTAGFGEEKDGFFGGRRLVRGSLSRSDSRGSIHSDRARELVRRFKSSS